MAASNASVTEVALEAKSVFGSVLVGIDGSPAALEAARQAAVLAEGPLELLAVYDITAGLFGGYGPTAPAYYDEEKPRSAAQEALRAASEAIEQLGSAEVRIARGRPWEELLREIARREHTLVAVGAHGSGRISGIVLGSAPTELVHKSPCSVLVAREARPDFPHRIVVGIDGSPESAVAYDVARYLAGRFSAELWPVVAHGGKGVDKQLVAKIVDAHHEDLPDEPVRALVSAAADADLLVVGSRGLHGLKALGSVSERVAHQARCSTLVVRAHRGAVISEKP